jgi:hypothetical protein
MAQPKPAPRRNERKTEVATAGSVHPRHEQSGYEADAWRESTGLAMRLLEWWKGSVARAERDLFRIGCWLVALDVLAALSACFVPILSSLFGIGRLIALVVFVPAALRGLAIRHADRPDSELVTAIAISIGIAAAYFAVRTMLVVQVCAL